MTFQIKAYDKTITIEHNHEDVNINDLVDDFVVLMEGITFPRSCIVNAFKEYIEDEIS